MLVVGSCGGVMLRDLFGSCFCFFERRMEEEEFKVGGSYEMGGRVECFLNEVIYGMESSITN